MNPSCVHFFEGSPKGGDDTPCGFPPSAHCCHISEVSGSDPGQAGDGTH